MFISSAHLQRGVTLIEAMVAVVVMAFGMVALAGLQSNFRRSADVAKQRGEAIRMSQQDVELQRAFSELTPPANPASGVRTFADIADGDETQSTGTNTSFGIERKVVALPQYGVTSVTTTVRWADRTGEPLTLQLDSLVAPVDPALAAFLQQPVEGAPARRPLERNAQIPKGAKNMGDGTSVFKPVQGANLVWVFNNLTGMITNKCNVDKAIADISKDDLAGCNIVTTGYFVSGYVRFSTGVAADPESPASPALPMHVQLQLVDLGKYLTPAYECFDDAPGVVGAQSVVAYYCIVYPNSAVLTTWSGRITLSGIPLGAGNYRVCRYSADYDGSGKVDNAEHPLDYLKVNGPLSRQNFLVVSFANNCPAGQPADPANGRFVNTATASLQP
ncbi:type IV pilus modification PilV family protein [Paucibacter soli]|uniref:type IV pilus modification PilV family protein n=1 Tax=Paucibacter soli TaxID=3133433 RepID=UPI0030B1FE5B